MSVLKQYNTLTSQWEYVVVGKRGLTGETGASAYEIAVANGYEGTEAEWISGLAGELTFEAEESAISSALSADSALISANQASSSATSAATSAASAETIVTDMVVGGAVVDGDLILTQYDTTTLNAGYVTGEPGIVRDIVPPTDTNILWIDETETPVDGLSVEMRVTATHIQWRPVDDVWVDLIPIVDLMGTDMTHVSPQIINVQTGTAYTLLSSDAGATTTFDNVAAITVTVLPDTFVAGQRVDCFVLGTGMVTVVAGTGMTVSPEEGLSLVSRAQRSGFTIFFLSPTVAIVTGSMAAM